MNQIARIEEYLPPARMAPSVSFEQQIRLAQSFANSRLFGIENADQALALMALCEAEGMHPAIAVRDYHIIKGKPALKADAMLARFQAAGGKVKWLAMTDDKVEGEFSHAAGGTVRIDWDKRRAEVAGFWGKDNWKKFPRAMLRARTISEGIRSVYPGVVVGVHTPEEMEDEPAREGAHSPPHERHKPEASPYADEAFDKNLPTWGELIAAGKKTPQQIIAAVQTKATLSDEQRNRILSLEQPE